MTEFNKRIHLFHTLCDGRRVSEAVNLIRTLSAQAYWLTDYIELGYGFFRVGMFEEAEHALEATLPYLAQDERQTARVTEGLAIAKLHLGKIDEGAVFDKAIYSREAYQVDASISENERRILNRIFQEKLLVDEESVEGKKVFLIGCGGFGDQIEQYRNIQRLLAEGAKVVVADPHESLMELLGESAIPVALTRATADNLSRSDRLAFGNMLNWRYARSAFSSLPEAGYLRPVKHGRPPVAIPETSKSKRVGIVWKSNNTQCRYEPFRSMELVAMEPLFLNTETQFYSLQFGELAPAEAECLKRFGVVDLSSHIRTFLDMAKLMMRLDLVITVDSAPAHLAGALDIPVWNMLAKVADWRWGAHGQRDTSLYPSMRLFRQQALGEWDAVVAEVAAALQAL
ncbi:glycosyltransferase family 9 protein [Paraburkholderia sp. J67]|uniref:glycosyltransferase family 9 protein n=1 Tax=Paraburkholderia sp. J67 TaxID=2805435 RepID=UPI002ABDAF2B|nr:glycosyltransferase family 9 protein [Paraburkholderia sp. J67]